MSGDWVLKGGLQPNFTLFLSHASCEFLGHTEVDEEEGQCRLGLSWLCFVEQTSWAALWLHALGYVPALPAPSVAP